MKPPEKNEIQIGQVFEQSRQNAEQITDLRSAFSDSISDLRKSIDRLGERLNTATAPNFSTMAAWAGVIVSIIFGVATPVTFAIISSAQRDREESLRNFQMMDAKLQKEYSLINETMIERVSSQRRALEELDVRLQREFLTANQTTRDTADVLKDTWGKRHDDLISRVVNLEAWQVDQTREDLKELRQRRMKQ